MKGRPKKLIPEGYCWCSRCQKEYLAENFYNDKSRGSGKKSVCIPCDNELRKIRRSEISNKSVLKGGHDDSVKAAN
jgi:hypothetical protein